MGDKVVSVADIEMLRKMSLGTDRAYDLMVTALDELLAYREGYDPQVRVPEYDVPVRIVWHFEGHGCQAIAKLTVYQGAEIYLPVNDTGNYVPQELVTRWYPLSVGGQ